VGNDSIHTGAPSGGGTVFLIGPIAGAWAAHTFAGFECVGHHGSIGGSLVETRRYDNSSPVGRENALCTDRLEGRPHSAHAAEQIDKRGTVHVIAALQPEGRN